MKNHVVVLSPPDFIDDVLFDMTHSVRNEPFQEHSHSCVEITIVLDGWALHRIASGSDIHRLERGDVCVIRPGGTHAMLECQDFDHITVSCSPDILGKTGINLGFIHGVSELFGHAARPVCSFHLNHSEFVDARQLCLNMFDIYNSERKQEKGSLRFYFAILLCLLAQSFSLHHSDKTSRGRMDTVLAFINKHYLENISLRQLATLAALSQSQLIRVFNKEYNITPIQYVIELRLNEGKRLLRESTLSISEIASLCGFQDTNYFSTLYKKRFGISPSGQRKPAGWKEHTRDLLTSST